MYRTFQFLWSSPLLSEFLVSSRHVRSVSNCATKAWISWPQNRIRVEGVRLALLQIMHTPWPCIGGVHVARYLKPDSKSGPAITKPNWRKESSSTGFVRPPPGVGSWSLFMDHGRRYQVSFYTGTICREGKEERLFLEFLKIRSWESGKKRRRKFVYRSRFYLTMRYKHFKFSWNDVKSAI